MTTPFNAAKFLLRDLKKGGITVSRGGAPDPASAKRTVSAANQSELKKSFSTVGRGGNALAYKLANSRSQFWHKPVEFSGKGNVARILVTRKSFSTPAVGKSHVVTIANEDGLFGRQPVEFDDGDFVVDRRGAPINRLINAVRNNLPAATVPGWWEVQAGLKAAGRVARQPLVKRALWKMVGAGLKAGVGAGVGAYAGKKMLGNRAVKPGAIAGGVAGLIFSAKFRTNL